MISVETYAELCALMGDTGGDVSKEDAIAAAQGVSAADWAAAKPHYTAKMSDPADMGKTALAFMPLYQAAQARMRGGGAPCTVDLFAKVHAEMANRKGADGKKIDYNIVLAEHGYTHQKWLACEVYWTPRVGDYKAATYVPAEGQEFNAAVQKYADVVNGISR
jgi:hypothetical protein